MPGKPLISRVPNHFVKTITFDGVTIGAADESDVVATVTGRVLITHLSAFCSTTLVGSGSISLGSTDATTNIITTTTGADLIADEFWVDATPTVKNTETAIINRLLADDLLLSTTTATITAGVIEFSMLWLPMSVDGNLA